MFPLFAALLLTTMIFGAGFAAGRRWEDERELAYFRGVLGFCAILLITGMTTILVDPTATLLLQSTITALVGYLFVAAGAGALIAFAGFIPAMLAACVAFVAQIPVVWQRTLEAKGRWDERRAHAKRLADPNSAEAIRARAQVRFDYLLSLIPEEPGWEELRAGLRRTHTELIPKYLERRDQLREDIAALKPLLGRYADKTKATGLVAERQQKLRAMEEAEAQTRHRIENAFKFLDLAEADIRFARSGVVIRKEPAAVREPRPGAREELLGRLRGDAPPDRTRNGPVQPLSRDPETTTVRVFEDDNTTNLEGSTSFFRTIEDDFQRDQGVWRNAAREVAGKPPVQERPRRRTREPERQ